MPLFSEWECVLSLVIASQFTESHCIVIGVNISHKFIDVWLPRLCSQTRLLESPLLNLLKNKTNTCTATTLQKAHISQTIPFWPIERIWDIHLNVSEWMGNDLAMKTWSMYMYIPACLCVRELSSGILLKTEWVCCVFAKQKCFPSPCFIRSLTCYPSALLY